MLSVIVINGIINNEMFTIKSYFLPYCQYYQVNSDMVKLYLSKFLDL